MLLASPEPEAGVEEPCLVLNGINVLDGMFKTGFATGATIFRCGTKVESTVTLFAGNTSLETFETLCGDTPLFSFDEESGVVNMTAFGLPFTCSDTLCAFYAIMGQDVLLSGAISPGDVEAIAAAADLEIPFLVTELLYDFDEGMGEEFALAIINGFETSVTDPLLLRGVTFLATVETTCLFPEDD
ncbi:hypothetical protein FGB62_126g013 [Gracilaria domingensis]|nr:hypothetical protein FGB62_126g013 [Gracilaria domingensis]